MTSDNMYLNNEYVKGWNGAIDVVMRTGSWFPNKEELLEEVHQDECKGCTHRYDGGWCIRCCRNKKDCYEGGEEEE